MASRSRFLGPGILLTFRECLGGHEKTFLVVNGVTVPSGGACSGRECASPDCCSTAALDRLLPDCFLVVLFFCLENACSGNASYPRHFVLTLISPVRGIIRHSFLPWHVLVIHLVSKSRS